jgi:DNA-binding transcriptional ArsR family regulator
MNDGDVDAVFGALADATRRDVMRRLSRSDAVTATDLAAAMPITRQAVSKHLAALSEAGLVTAERSGRETRYRLTPRPMAEAMSWMVEVGADWDERLRSLQRHLRGSYRTDL